VVHFVHLANLVMRWLLQIQMHDRHTNTSPVACSGLSSASLSGLQPRSRLLPSATLPRPQPLIRASVHLRIATRPMSRVQVMIAAIGCACVFVSARVTFHEVMRRARKRELHSTHARHTDSLRPSIRICPHRFSSYYLPRGGGPRPQSVPLSDTSCNDTPYLLSSAAFSPFTSFTYIRAICAHVWFSSSSSRTHKDLCNFALSSLFPFSQSPAQDQGG
jgi:hypothetical protein